MFPLGTVLFPHAVLPLHVFEPRYRVMMRRCIDGDGEFGVVLIERGSEVGGGDARFDVGTIARIVQAAELDDGRFAIATVGLAPVPRRAVARRRSVSAAPRSRRSTKLAAPGRRTRRARPRVRCVRRRPRAVARPRRPRPDVGTAAVERRRPAISSRSRPPRRSARSTRSVCSKRRAESRAQLLEQLLADLGEELRARIDFE